MTAVVVLNEVAEVSNFGPIRALAPWTLPPPVAPDAGQWVFLVGPPGSGKTTLLRALALALVGASGARLLLRGEARPLNEDATLAAHFNGVRYQTTIRRVGQNRTESVHAATQAFLPVAGYGLGRTARGTAARPVSPLLSLFGEETLCSAAWVTRTVEDDALRAARAGRPYPLWDHVRAAVRACLGAEIVPAAARPGTLDHPTKGRVRLDALGDGELALVTLVLDLLYRWQAIDPDALARGGPSAMTGVVLIDSIDLFLPPAQQVHVQAVLRTLFPRLSFVVTVGSPLVLAEARRDEVFVLNATADRHVAVRPSPLDPRLRTVSELYEKFGGIEKLFPSLLGEALQRYSFLAANPYRTDEEEAACRAAREVLVRAGIELPFEPEPRATAGG